VGKSNTDTAISRTRSKVNSDNTKSTTDDGTGYKTHRGNAKIMMTRRQEWFQ
jgi:hypothetical protein